MPSAQDADTERRCPVCGVSTAAERCPEDGTRTVSVGVFSRDATSYRPGEVLADRYRITGTLGRGGFGAVYAAEHTETNHPVAIKLLGIDPSTASDDVVRRFYREARITARLTAQHTVRVFDVGQTVGGPLFLAMELLHGPTLEQALRQLSRAARTMSEAEAIDVAIPILKSLAEAHGAGLVHRDLKPANIVLAEVGDGETVVKVLDFGIALTSDSSLTEKGSALGTPGYMSPEQVRAKRLDGRADLYSLGCILFRCVTGRLPFEHPDAFAQAFMHATEPVPDPEPLRAAAGGDPLSDGFLATMLRCLAKQPAHRFEDARSLRTTLEAVRGGNWAGTPQSTWRYQEVPARDGRPARATVTLDSGELIEIPAEQQDDEPAATLIASGTPPDAAGHGRARRGPATLPLNELPPVFATSEYAAGAEQDAAAATDEAAPQPPAPPGAVTVWLEEGDTGHTAPSAALSAAMDEEAATDGATNALADRRALIGMAVVAAAALVGAWWWVSHDPTAADTAHVSGAGGGASSGGASAAATAVSPKTPNKQPAAADASSAITAHPVAPAVVPRPPPKAVVPPSAPASVASPVAEPPVNAPSPPPAAKMPAPELSTAKAPPTKPAAAKPPVTNPAPPAPRRRAAPPRTTERRAARPSRASSAGRPPPDARRANSLPAASPKPASVQNKPKEKPGAKDYIDF